MTIAKTGNKSQYNGDGVTLAFAFAYRFFADGDLGVYTLTAGVETKKVLTTHYTVSNTGTESGGTVTFLVAPATGTTVTISGEISETQTADYAENDAFSAETHETALDRGVRITQQVSEKVSRSIKVPVSSSLTDVELSGITIGAAIIGNPAGDGLIPGPTAAEISSAQGYATAASDSADEAAASAAAAATFDPANFQPIDAALTSLAGLTLAANKGLYSTAADTVALYDLTAAGLALLDDADAAAQRVTLGLGSRIVETVAVTPADLDTITENGYFQASNTTLNTPLPSLFWEGFSWASTGGVVRRQLIWRRFSTEFYHRRYASGVWSAWVRLPHTGEVLGIDQTWQDMVGSRAYGTSYQNTTGKPIIVAAYSVSGSTRAERAQVSSDGVTWLTLKEVPSGTFVGDLSISDKVIPNGWYYRIVLVSGTAPTITAWMELR